MGTYKLIHTSTSGSGSVPCTPGFVVDDVDSIEFYVVNSALSSVTFKVDMNNVTEGILILKSTPRLIHFVVIVILW